MRLILLSALTIALGYYEYSTALRYALAPVLHALH